MLDDAVHSFIYAALDTDQYIHGLDDAITREEALPTAEARVEAQRAAAAGQTYSPVSPPCYICYEYSTESGELVVRACACRGAAGFVHAECLKKMVASSSNPAASEYWVRCPTCKECWQGELMLTMARG